jgi:hypothetical protein
MKAQNRDQMFAQQAAGSTAEQVQGSSKETWKKFAEPRGWALKWDGFALSEIEEWQNGRAPLMDVTRS